MFCFLQKKIVQKAKEFMEYYDDKDMQEYVLKLLKYLSRFHS